MAVISNPPFIAMTILRFVACVLLTSSAVVVKAIGAQPATLNDPMHTELWSNESIPCSTAVERSERLNGPQLFQATMACFKDGNSSDGTFLLIAGQIRSTTDMSLLTAVGDIDEIAQGELYGAIFYRLGGAGDESLLRDSQRSALLFARLESWKPLFYEGYKPGWNYKSSSKTALYDQVALQQMRARLDQLKSYAVLISNDEYYAARQEMSEIQKRNPGGVVAGSADYERMSELSTVTSRIADQLEQRTTPESEPAILDPFEPDPDADFVQLYVGSNGAESPEEETFVSEEEVRKSWLTLALKPEELEGVLSQVDFGKQVLVALSIGKRQNATGTVHIARVSYNAILESWSVDGLVGVNIAKCDQPWSTSYPFALAAAARPPKEPRSRGYGSSNFPDGCKPPMMGKPSKVMPPQPNASDP